MLSILAPLFHLETTQALMVMTPLLKIAVVIPCYRVRRHILKVLAQIGSEVSRIYVIDDACPEQSGDFVKAHCYDPRVKIIKNSHNLGVGGTVMKGYQAALEAGDIDIIVKIDGDGQMDPRLIPSFILPILSGQADYTKGNRFFDLEKLKGMPKIRLFGNAVLSFMAKLSTGYWNLFDPTNGYTAIHINIVRLLPLEKISNRYFFETDLLFRLNILRASVIDIPMVAQYNDEKSNLKIAKIFSNFLSSHIKNFFKRIFYNYYLRDMSLASIELPLGLCLVLFGLIFGMDQWHQSITSHLTVSAGTVMLSALPLIIGLQLILSFLGQDIRMVPTKSIYPLMGLLDHSLEKNLEINTQENPVQEKCSQ